jgi:hypothetical protein
MQDVRQRKSGSSICDWVMTIGYIAVVPCSRRGMLAQKPAVVIIEEYGPAIGELEEQKGKFSVCCEVLMA